MGSSARSDRHHAEVKAWSDSIANLAADALVDGGIIGHEKLGAAAAIIAEEIYVRLCLLDAPPSEKASP